MTTVLFVCVHNAGRSQMAEAIFNERAAKRGVDARAISAGTVPGDAVNPAAIVALNEMGISADGLSPKRLTDELSSRADHVITMGCGVDAEACPARIRPHLIDWGLDDPRGQPVETVRAIRDQIAARVEMLLDQIVAEHETGRA